VPQVRPRRPLCRGHQWPGPAAGCLDERPGRAHRHQPGRSRNVVRANRRFDVSSSGGAEARAEESASW